MTSESTIATQIRTALAQHLKRDVSKIHPQDRLREDLGLDSLAMIELLFKIEEHFDLEIPNEDLSRVTTVADVTAYVEEKLGATAAPAAPAARGEVKPQASRADPKRGRAERGRGEAAGEPSESGRGTERSEGARPETGSRGRRDARARGAPARQGHVDQGGSEAQGRASFSQGGGEEEGLAPGMNGRPGPPAARLDEIAGAVGGTVVGAPDTMITGVSSLAEAVPGDIAYVEDERFAEAARGSRAAAFVVASASLGSESHRSSSPNPASPSSGSSRPSSPPLAGPAASPAR
jgi:acyl carrier protein